jgi:phage terminase large subunit
MINLPSMTTTSVFKRILMAYDSGIRLIVQQGGTSSGKTYSTLQLLIILANYIKEQIIISVVSETIPHLKRGCIRDFEKIMGMELDTSVYNKTDHTYKFDKTTLEFFSADDSSKLRGGRRDILFINECNNTTKDSFDELDVRTRLLTIVDFNPTSEFWLHEILRSKGIKDFSEDCTVGDTAFIHSTYNDARAVLPESVVSNIESRRETDKNWWRVYGLGLVGKIEGLIHPDFTTIDRLPNEGICGYGLDLGFTDPAALVKNVLIGDTLYSQELFYQTGMTNQDISKKFTELGLIKGRSEIIADCAEPKSIEDLHRMGWNIKPSIKGQGSFETGIKKVNQYHQVWTKDSTNGIKEQRNYMFDKDKDGKLLDSDDNSNFNHLMAARRYWLVNKTIGTKKVFIYNEALEVKMKIDWSMGKTGILHYVAFALMPNGTLYSLFLIWDKRAGQAYIYDAEKYDIVIPDVVAEKTILKGNLRRVIVNKIMCNKMFLSSGKSTASIIRKSFLRKDFKKGFSEPQMFDMRGSIVFINNLFNEKLIYINRELYELCSQLNGWSYKENERDLMDNCGYCECLCMVASELKKEIVKEEKKKRMVDYEREV